MPEQKKWEYDTAILTSDRHQDKAILDKWGALGWELVTVTAVATRFDISPTIVAYFKKEIAV